jgi:hypothetical protein
MFSADHLTLALGPPPDKTREQRAERKSREHDAQVVSDKIDEDNKKERLALRKQKNTIHILLLGQSESGKSRSLLAFHTYACLPSGKSTTFRSTTSFVTKPNQ